MAVAAPALHHHLRLRFSNPITRTRPSLPRGATAFLTHLQIHQNSARISLISCSSTSLSTEANTDTPESCVNLGLQLFSKGRVISHISLLIVATFNFFEQILRFCEMGVLSFSFLSRTYCLYVIHNVSISMLSIS